MEWILGAALCMRERRGCRRRTRLHGGGDIRRVRLGLRRGGLREKEKETPEPNPRARVI